MRSVLMAVVAASVLLGSAKPAAPPDYPVTFIKVDIEGFERRLMLGAERVLGLPQIAWQFEVKPSGLRAVGDDPAEFYRDLHRACTHFIDLNRRAVGGRVRPITDLPEALRYIEPDQKTDILLFTACDGRVA